jgi:hypothetical protein
MCLTIDGVVVNVNFKKSSVNLKVSQIHSSTSLTMKTIKFNLNSNFHVHFLFEMISVL